ncbi:MAG: hypothetical protein AAFX99_25205, partial [Myxococcota bacterium]
MRTIHRASADVRGNPVLAEMTRQEAFATQAKFYGRLLDPERPWSSASTGLPLTSALARWDAPRV